VTIPDGGSAGPGRHEFRVEADKTVRLDSLVASRLGLSRTQAATLISTGKVMVDGASERAGSRPKGGQRVMVEIAAPPPRRDVVAEDISLDIAFEDEHLLVIDKAAGMVVHPAPGNWSGTLVNALRGRGAALSALGEESDREGIVHRLDKETSGLLVVAKTDRAHRQLSAAIAGRRVVRRYALLAWGHLKDDRRTVEAPIGRDPRDRKRMAIVSTGRAARTDFVRIARFGAADLLRAHLHTGRTHQIRVHLASIGHPVVGDDTYGGGGGRRLVALPLRRHFLHAAWLIFVHPESGERLDLRSPLPADLRHSLAAVAESAELAEHPDPLAFLGFYDND
jgi:23S rRNA pseudouridine1911/1915/1917 synthase